MYKILVIDDEKKITDMLQDYLEGQDLHVTKKKFELISFLAMNKGQTFSKEQMYERLWGYDVEGESRTITEHIKNYELAD